jgi:hypothetical protein
MPNRVIREGFIDSEAVNSLNDASECFYHRLMLAADDAGRYDGRSEMLRSRLFPLKARLRPSDIDTHILDCLKQGLLMRYQWLNKPFIQLMKWQRCSPCAVSKYPWSDGSHRIEYIKLDTRDGVKDFVKTSIQDPMPIPYLSHTGGICLLSHGCTETETETETIKADGLPPASRKKEKMSDADWWKSLVDKFPGIDMDVQKQRAEAWILTHPGRQFTRRFFLNWLLRTDAPIGADIGKPKSIINSI